MTGGVPWSLFAWCRCARNRVGPGRREAPRFGPLAPCPRGRLHTPPASARHRSTRRSHRGYLALRRPPHLLRYRRPQEHADRLPAHDGCLGQTGSRRSDVPHRHRPSRSWPAGSSPPGAGPSPWRVPASTGSRCSTSWNRPGWRSCLVNAQHVKNVPGRKTDVKDAEWLATLLRVGLLRAELRPARGDPRTARPDPLPHAGDPPAGAGVQSHPEGAGGRQHQAGEGGLQRPGGQRTGDALDRWTGGRMTRGTGGVGPRPVAGKVAAAARGVAGRADLHPR